MIKKKLAAKAKATGIHFSISVVLFVFIAYLIVYQWYPLPFFYSEGGWQGIRLMFLVDVVLGPLLTFIIFNQEKTKRQITIDLSVIGIFQLVALIWGGMIIYEERPAVIVQHEGIFHPIKAKRLALQDANLDELQKLSDVRPPVVYSIAARTREQYLAQKKRLERGIAETEQVETYRTIKENMTEVFSFTLRVEDIIKDSPGTKLLIDKFLQRHGGKLGDYHFCPYNGRFEGGWIIFNKKGDFVDIITG